MRNVSSAFLTAMKTRTDFKERADIRLTTNGTLLNLTENDFTLTNNSIKDGAELSTLPLGEAVSKMVQLEIDNHDGSFSNYDFFGADIHLYLTFKTTGTTVETIDFGHFTVITPETYGDTILISAQDVMYKADKPYNNTSTTTRAASTVLRDVCSKCGISLLSTTFTNSTMSTNVIPSNVYTCRQIIGYIAMLAYGNAYINNNNQLVIKSYDFNFANTAQTLDDWISLKTDFNDISITGIQGNYQYVSTNAEGEQTTEDRTTTTGTTNYMLIVENPLVTQLSFPTFVRNLGTALMNKPFRKFEGEYTAYPLAEFMDTVKIKDRKGNVYNSIITDIDFTFFGVTTLKNSAESALSSGSSYSTAASDSYAKTKELVQREKTNRELAVENLAKKLSESSGLFMTEDVQPDGSTIYYMHNKPTLDESDIIWKLTAEAFGISTDGGNTYPYGFTVDGELITRLLYAEGINADYINTGAITVRDNEGNVLFIADIVNHEVMIAGWEVTKTSIVSSDKSLELNATETISLTTHNYLGIDENYNHEDLSGLTHKQIRNLKTQTLSRAKMTTRNGDEYVDIDSANIIFYKADIEKMELDPGGQRFYSDDGAYLGFTGTNHNQAGENGIVFDLDLAGDYMSWGIKTEAEGLYNQIFTYFRSSDQFDFQRMVHLNRGLYVPNDCEINIYSPIEMNGFAILNTQIEETSDIKLKENIAPTDVNALDVINNIDMVQFDWKENGEHENIGYVAQQIGSVSDDLEGVQNDVHTVKEQRLIRYLVKAVQELSQKVKELEDKQ